MTIEAKSRLLAFERMDSNVANALWRGLRKLDPSIGKPKITDTQKGAIYTFQPATKQTMDNIVKSIAALDEANSSVSNDTVRFSVSTDYGVEYEEEFKVIYNEGEPDAKLFQVQHIR